MKGIALQFSFDIFVWFWIRVILTSWNQLGVSQIKLLCESFQALRVATTQYQDKVSQTTAIYFLTVLDAKSQSSRCWQVCFLLRSCSLACIRPLLAVSSHGLSLCLHIPLQLRSPVIQMQCPTFRTFNLTASLKTLSPNAVTLRVRTSTFENKGREDGL